MLAQDFCYWFAVASRSSRYTSDLFVRSRPNAVGGEALHVNPVAMFYQSKQLMLLLRVLTSETKMARMSGLETMTYAELAELRSQVDRLIVEKQSSERSALRQKMADLARDHGLSLDEVLGKGRKGKGSVAPKYRDPKNPENTWTGHGRMPLWMVAATKGSKAKKDDFLI
jgi:DNA-binding protein H-NS